MTKKQVVRDWECPEGAGGWAQQGAEHDDGSEVRQVRVWESRNKDAEVAFVFLDQETPPNPTGSNFSINRELQDSIRDNFARHACSSAAEDMPAVMVASPL